MTDNDNEEKTAEYTVGYRKPPIHSRFRKGQSGNPRGRPRGAMTSWRAKALALKEAYRPVTIKEGDQFFTMPALQAVMRRQVALAAKGNGPAQRAVIEAVQKIESQLEARIAAKQIASADEPALSDIEVARSIAFTLARACQTKP